MMNTSGALQWLRSKHGIWLSESALRYAIRDGCFPAPERLGDAFVWTETDCDRLFRFCVAHNRGRRVAPGLGFRPTPGWIMPGFPAQFAVFGMIWRV